MSKPAPRRIPSDDYEKQVLGEWFHPHEGEAIELVGSATVGELQAIQRFRHASVELDAVKGDPDGFTRSMEILDGVFEEMCQRLATRLTRWDWTDDAGRPLVPFNDEWADPDTGEMRPCSKLDGSPEPFKALSAPELYYLSDLAQSEAPAEAKKDGSASSTTSSDTTSAATKSTTSARSHTKRS